MADFLLIHGAWHGGWCWERLVPLLEAEGHKAHAPTLSGLEQARSESVESIDLRTHVGDVVRAARELEAEEVVLVGHSYAGFPITGAADQLRERVALYVYLDAGVPDAMTAGTSFAWSDGSPAEAREERLEAIVDQGLGPVLPAPPPEAFGVESAVDLELLAEKTRPMPAGTFTGRFRLEKGGSTGLPRAYIHSVDPCYAPLGEIPDRVRKEPGWGFHELASGHDAMLSAPELLADALLSLAGDG